MKNESSRAAVMKGAKTLTEILEHELKDPKFAKAYRGHLLQAIVAEQLTKQRAARHMTQKKLADRVGMKQAAVARIESGEQNLSLATISTLAGALGCRVQVTLHPA